MQEIQPGSDVKVDGVWYRVENMGVYRDVETKVASKLVFKIRELDEAEIKKAEGYHV